MLFGAARCPRIQVRPGPTEAGNAFIAEHSLSVDFDASGEVVFQILLVLIDFLKVLNAILHALELVRGEIQQLAQIVERLLLLNHHKVAALVDDLWARRELNDWTIK
jgi:hypothetical protein